MHTCMKNSLPSEIIIEILSRLPTESALKCRQVCQTWKHLLRQPSFAHKHLHQLLQLDDNSNSSHSSLIASKVCSGFLFLFKFTGEHGRQLYYGEYDDQLNKKLRRINQPPNPQHSIVGSCNGLICFSKDGLGPHSSYDYEPTHICNPITSEYVNLPGLTYRDKVQFMVCGFGYHRPTNKYKIVRIYYIPNQPLGQVQVYTLGSGIGWKDLGETAYSLGYTCRHFDDRRSPFATFANGALHWLDEEQKIVSFGLSDETFYLLPSPAFVRAASVQNYFKLQVLGGCLCFIHQKRDEFLDIWFLRKKGGNSCYDVNEQDYNSWSWIKEFSIPIESDAEPFALTNSGQVLFHYNSGVFCYDPETTAVSDNLISNEVYHVTRLVPHMNSLVSLQGLPEIWLPRKRYNVNPAPKEIFIKQWRKDNGEIGVNPSLTLTQYLGKQAVSPIQAIGSNLMPVGVEASHSSKATDRNVSDSRQRKEKSLKCNSHCSERPEKRDSSPQQLYSSDENSPLSHSSRRSICERGSDVGSTERIVADVEEFSDHDGDTGETCGEVDANLPLKRVTKRHRDDSDMNDQGNEKSGSEPDIARGPDVGQPRERGKGSSLMYSLGCSDRGQVDRPMPEYAAPQQCPPNFLMVAGFPVLPEYKDLYTRVIISKGHIATNTKVKSMYIQATMVEELLETIQQMSELSSRDVTFTNLQQWRATIDTASAMDFHVSWLDDQLHLFESQFREAEKQTVTRRSLEVKVRSCEERISLLHFKVDEAKRAYKAAKVDKAELTAELATLKASLASFEESSNQACSALGSCLDTPH